MTNAIDVTQLMLVDAGTLAEQVEAIAGVVLKPISSGIYLPWTREPVMVPGKQYFQLAGNTNSLLAPAQQEVALSLNEIAEGTGGIFDENGEIVIMHGQRKRASFSPTISYRGIDLITAVIQHLIDTRSAWMSSPAADRIIETIMEHLNDYLDRQVRFEAAEKIADILMELRTDVNAFIGKDEWIMHFQKPWGRTGIVIEKTIDYRIYDWNRRMESGEWKNNE